FLKRQSVWLGVGLAACITAALIDYHFWQRTWWIWIGVAAITLALCYAPHIGMRINGSRRWIGFGPIGFQPSEIAKLAAIFFLAWWFSRYEQLTRNPIFGFAIPLAVVSGLLAMILFEVDLGTTALIGATTFVIMFVTGTNPILLVLLAVIGSSVIFVAATHSRMERLMAFTNLERYKEDAGLQQMQALIAWGSGGMDGLGLGNGR